MSRFAVFFSILTALHIAASSFAVAYVPYFTKPVLMLFLALFFYRNAPKPLSRLSKVTLYALFFSWLGDVLLMFQGFQAIYFLLGLVSFLLAHLCYIFALSQTPKSQKSSSKIVMGASLLYVLIGIGSITLLKDGLGSMFIPVVVYAATIIGMNLAAVSRYGKVSSTSFWWVMFGAVSFLISDSLLGINKFHTPIPAPSLLVMSTYCLGQFMIVGGILQQLWDQNIPKLKTVD